MSPAALSLIALAVAIVLSMTSRINVGVVSLALAWLVGTFVAHLGATALVENFPGSLFLTLTGITLLFAAAEVNGTLERLAHLAIRLARGNARMLPLIFFVIASVVSAAGPGAISSVALVAPLAMVIGGRAGVPYFLTALVVANGANAGNLSPVSSVGVIVNTKMAAVGLGGHETLVWFANFAASVLVALAAYIILGGHRLTGAVTPVSEAGGVRPAVSSVEGPASMTTGQRVTVVVIAAWIAGVLVWKIHLGFSAFAAAGLLVIARTVDEGEAMRRVPWGVIIMVTGVSTLVALLQATGGMDLFTALLAGLATPGTVNGVMAFVTGAISLWSSTSGVVLPAFLPTVPGVIDQLGGGNPLALALSINIGSSLVDVSPLSTLGALCVAAAPDGPAAAQLFRRLLIWGLAMAVAGAVICQVFANVLARGL